MRKRGFMPQEQPVVNVSQESNSGPPECSPWITAWSRIIRRRAGLGAFAPVHVNPQGWGVPRPETACNCVLGLVASACDKRLGPYKALDYRRRRDLPCAIESRWHKAALISTGWSQQKDVATSRCNVQSSFCISFVQWNLWSLWRYATSLHGRAFGRLQKRSWQFFHIHSVTFRKNCNFLS
jgi:hypothetical protein